MNKDVSGEKLGPALRELRKALGLSLDRVPDITKGALSKIESGESMPGIGTLVHLCATYDVEIVITGQGLRLTLNHPIEGASR